MWEKKIKKKTKASLARGYNLLLSILGIYTQSFLLHPTDQG